MGGTSAETVFEIDERIYPLEAVQNAAYSFTDRAFVRVEPSGTGKLKVTMTAKPALPASATVRGEFDNELVHQALRLRVSESNRKIREFIVTKALVSAQPSAVAVAAAAETCVECASGEAPPSPAAPAPIDEALEKEIDRLLAEIEGGDSAADPLGVSVPWEEKFGKKAGPADADKPAVPARKPAKAAKPKAPGKAKGR
ncbi:MAG: His-Xaa-Ser system protein HxsD [Elusimicrobia bacterium]|nr:His-Xaa-Ser system protein HxsD [Elusimicrobiota bacterium]